MPPSRVKLDTGDLWSPGDPLPGGAVLRRMAARVAALWEMPELVDVTIGYNGRLRTTLGRALLDEGRVELNPRLLRDHPDQLVSTLAHELAHLAVHVRFGRRAGAHGREFRTLMRALNLDARATHNLPVEHLRRRRRRYIYLHRCDQCGRSAIARRVLRDRICSRCGPGMQWDVYRVPDTPAGRALLETLAGR